MAQPTEPQYRPDAWAYTNARTYLILLTLRDERGSEQWTIRAGWNVTHVSGEVIINAQAREIAWLDLAPDDEEREWKTLHMPKVNSIGATVTVARALAEMIKDGAYEFGRSTN